MVTTLPQCRSDLSLEMLHDLLALRTSRLTGRLLSFAHYTGNFVASRILYNVQLTVLSIQLYFLHIKTVSFLHGCTAKIKYKLSVLRAYLVSLSYFFENYRDKLPFIICKSNPYNIVNIIIYKFPQ